MKPIETERTCLRRFCPDDLAAVHAFCSQPEIEAVGFAVHKTTEDSEKQLERWVAYENAFAVVLKETGAVIGYLIVHDDSEDGLPDVKELGYALNRDYYRRGIMTEVVRGALDELFSEGIREVWACCFQSNLPSKGLIEKVGFSFVQEGTYSSESLHTVFSSYEYRMTKDEWEKRK